MRLILFVLSGLLLLAAMAGPAPAAAAVLQRPGVRVEYPPQQAADAARAVAAAEQAIARARDELGLEQPRPITLILYPTHREFAHATGTSRRQFIVGIATSAHGTAQVDASGLASDLATVVAHETAHLMLAQATDHAIVPLWFNEGYAEHASGSLVASAREVLADSLAEGGLLELSDMDGYFPHDGRAATIAYAQSYDLVTYILEHSPPGTLREVVRRLRAGDPFESVLTAVTGRSSSAWDIDWRSEFRDTYRWHTWLVFGLGIIGAVMAVLCLLAYRAVQRRKALLPDDLW